MIPSRKEFSMPYDPGIHSEFSSSVPADSIPYPVDNALAIQPEEKTKRALGFLIDLVPALFLGLLNFLPIVGWVAHGFLAALYWLLRDITGASPGKMVTGSLVVSADGLPATTGQRILRNLPLALPGIVGMIPFIGIIFEVVVAVPILVIEIVLLLVTGRRLGDRLAGTIVVRK